MNNSNKNYKLQYSDGRIINNNQMFYGGFPQILKDEKITNDTPKLSESVEKQVIEISNQIIENFLKSKGYDNIYGAGAVGIKTENIDGERTSVLKSVNDIIFKGDGVTITREGKNIEVNIPGASVVAGDPTIDFARESSVLELYTSLQSVYTLLEAISSVGFITNYTDGIGGSTGYWQAY